MNRFLILFFLLLSIASLPAQVCSFSFDEAMDSDCADRLQVFGDSTYVNGLSGLGRYMDGSQNFFRLVMDSTKVANGFSLAFWFLPADFEGDQILLTQSDMDGQMDVRVALAGNRAMVQQRDEVLSHSSEMLPNQWYFCAYTFQDGFVSVRIENSSFRFAQQALWEGEETQLFMGQYQGHSFFQGIYDELEVHDAALNTRAIRKRLELYSAKARENNDDLRLNKFKNRVNEIQDSLKVNSLIVTLKVWDDDLRDDDVLKIYVNGEPLADGTVSLRKNKDPIELRLQKDKPNEILFYALSMGRYEEFNTASVRVLVGDVNWGEYELRANGEKNAVLQIRFDEYARPVAGDQRAALNPNEQKLRTIRTGSDKIKLYYKDYSLSDKDELAIKFNEKPFLVYRLNKNDRNSDFLLAPGQNDIWLKANKSGLFKCTAAIVARDDSGRKLGEYELAIGKKDVYRLPVIYKPKPSTRRELAMAEDKIIIRLLDDQEYDGDTLAITQNGELILDDQELTKTAVDLEVQLLKNQRNVFQFIPVSTGTAGGNSCLVSILTPDKKKVLTQFKMEAYLQEQPALLIINHNSP